MVGAAVVFGLLKLFFLFYYINFKHLILGPDMPKLT